MHLQFKRAHHAALEGSWKWLSLFYSAFFFISFFWADLTQAFVLASVLIYTIFFVLYLALVYLHRSLVPVFIGAMILLGVAGADVNPSSTIAFNYAAFFAGYFFNLKNTIVTLILIISGLFLSALMFDLWHAYYFFPGIVPTVALALTGTMIQQNILKDERERESAAEKRQLAALAERERIARDLHDTLGHSLSSIALKAQLAKKLGDRGNSEAALEEIDQVAKLASATLSEVRQAISGYRKKGLPEQLEILSSRLEDGGFDTHIEGELCDLNANAEASLILMLTEAVTNILRHSNGSLVKINMNQQDGVVQLCIHDNGQVKRFKPGNGIEGLQERLQGLNGRLAINTAAGFQLEFIFPC